MTNARTKTAFLTTNVVLDRVYLGRCLPGQRKFTCRLHRPRALATASAADLSEPKRRSNTLVLVGLGNPGPRYSGTRHNVGFEAVDSFAQRHGGTFSAHKAIQADIAVAQVGSCVVHVVKPRTFMNLSGDAVRAVLRKADAPPSSLLVVVDDMALDVGRLRLRAKGSSGGHNGLKSIELRLGSREYARLKIGVGSPSLGAEQWKDYVLSKFSRNESRRLQEVMLDCMDVLDLWVSEPDINRVINQVGNLVNKGK